MLSLHFFRTDRLEYYELLTFRSSKRFLWCIVSEENIKIRLSASRLHVSFYFLKVANSV